MYDALIDSHSRSSTWKDIQYICVQVLAYIKPKASASCNANLIYCESLHITWQQERLSGREEHGDCNVHPAA